MVQSYVNIKHSNRSHLYWGIDKTTGKIVGIDSVNSRGLDCNCKCAACNGDFIARKGEHNRHHFAHVSNYECVYANEIAIYLLVQKLLDHEQKFKFPSVTVRIGQREEIAKNPHTLTLTNTYYHCTQEQYPPLLLATFDDRPVRILLDFNHYYSSDDFRLLQLECKSKDWDCISISLPHLSDTRYSNPIELRELISENIDRKNWIQSALKDRWTNRLNDAAINPKKYPTYKGHIRYECPLHCQYYEGAYYAVTSDCDRCEYNLSIFPECKCLGYAGIRHLKDFKRPTKELQQEILSVQRKNEDRLQRIEEAHKIQSLHKSFQNPQ